MSERPISDDFAPLVEFVEELRMAPANRPAVPLHHESGEAILLTSSEQVQNVPAQASGLSLHAELGQLVADESLLHRMSARQLYALFSLAGSIDNSTRQRFAAEVARRRESDPTNYHLRMLADELGPDRG